MLPLADLALKQAYHKPEDNIAESFYLPCMARAMAYDRAVGYFSSAIYALAWPSLRQFVDNGGRMRLVCSPVLSPDDVSAMAAGYDARIALEQQTVRAEFQKLLNTPGMTKPTRVLGALVALEVIDIKIAWVGEAAGPKPRRLFHDKLGIFRDNAGNSVAFKGSMNETWPGLAVDGNLESVDVFLSWAGDRERQRIFDEQHYFNRLWDGTYAGVKTVPLPDVAREDLISAADTEHWRELVEEICVEIGSSASPLPDSGQGGRTPRPHQIAALDEWQRRGRRGIFEHATGSGKTFTALCAIDESFKLGEVVLVLVPSDLLLNQWMQELKSTFESEGLRLLLCGAGHSDWRSGGRLRAWTRAGSGEFPRAVLATVQTASTSEFLSNCRGGKHLFVVADEVHRLGAAQARPSKATKIAHQMGAKTNPAWQ